MIMGSGIIALARSVVDSFAKLSAPEDLSQTKWWRQRHSGYCKEQNNVKEDFNAQTELSEDTLKPSDDVK